MLRTIYFALPIVVTLGAAHASESYDGMAPEEILQALIDESGSAYLNQSPQNRQMMPDNPAYWVAEEGEELFKTPRGPNNVSLAAMLQGLTARAVENRVGLCLPMIITREQIDEVIDRLHAAFKQVAGS